MINKKIFIYILFMLSSNLLLNIYTAYSTNEFDDSQFDGTKRLTRHMSARLSNTVKPTTKSQRLSVIKINFNQHSDTQNSDESSISYRSDTDDSREILMMTEIPQNSPNKSAITYANKAKSTTQYIAQHPHFIPAQNIVSSKASEKNKYQNILVVPKMSEHTVPFVYPKADYIIKQQYDSEDSSSEFYESANRLPKKNMSLFRSFIVQPIQQLNLMDTIKELKDKRARNKTINEKKRYNHQKVSMTKTLDQSPSDQFTKFY